MKKSAQRQAYSSVGIVGPILRPEIRDSLAAELKPTLPKDDASLVSFVKAVDEHLSIYRHLERPMFDAESAVNDALKRVRSYAEKINIEIGRLDTQDWMFLGREVSIVLASDGITVNADAILAAPSILAKTIDKLLKKKPSARHRRPNARSGNIPIDAPILRFVHNIAASYAEIYGEMPSSAAGGTFSKALQIILQRVEIAVEFGETRLKAIIQGLPADMPSPKRGPKTSRKITS